MVWALCEVLFSYLLTMETECVILSMRGVLTWNEHVKLVT